MEEIFLKTLPNIGVGVAAVVVLYLCFKVAINALNERDKTFKDFVQNNNHKSVEVMTECRDVIKEAAENIRQSTELSKQVMEQLIKNKD